MEDLLFQCSTCEGRRILDYSNSPWATEPWLGEYGECYDCDGKGYKYHDDEVNQRIDDIDSLIEGMMIRLADLSKWAMECKRGGLDNLATRYTNRMDTCARALARLKAYRTKLIKL
jgi:hypothetical protein